MTDDLVKRLRELAGRYDEAAERIEKLEAGLNALVNCQSALPRAAIREAAADILEGKTWHTEDQSPFVSQNRALRARIEQLEAALRKIGEGDVCVSLMTHPPQCGRGLCSRAYQARYALREKKDD